MADRISPKPPWRVRGRPFEKGPSGNPAGRRTRCSNKATIVAAALLEGESEALTRKAVELAFVQVLSLCSAFRGRPGSPKTSRDNSRLGAFNSRLSRSEFPVRSATGIRTQRYDLPNVSCRQTAVTGRKGTKFPLLREKPGMLHSVGATGHSPAYRARSRYLPHRYPISGRGNARRSRRPRGFAEIR
jgi:hypothetical protein